MICKFDLDEKVIVSESKSDQKRTILDFQNNFSTRSIE